MNAISVQQSSPFTQAPRLPLRPTLGDAASPALIDSPSVQFLTDMAIAVPSLILANEYHGRNNWSAFFWVVGGMGALKAMIDLSRVRTR